MNTVSDPGFFERVRFGGTPVANPACIVESGNARFTVLTSRLFRLEWSETGEFEDRGTYAFPTRQGPHPEFKTGTEGGQLTLDTGHLALRYRMGAKFAADSLSISFKLGDQHQVWVPGLRDPLNLRGTRRTLDVCEGDAALEEGLLSRSGWSLFDDSRSILFDPTDGWPVPRPDHELQDWYFFGYGHDYKAALAEYTRFGGSVPLVPRFVLGAWWSRYWAYSDQDLKKLVRDFEKFDLPLDVMVIDMDWHTPHSWTGYSWNRELFPDPPAFLQWLHDRGLKVTLNLHPAQGVQSFEDAYPRFARAMGQDPAEGQTVPFRISDKRFARNYFELLHYPLEDDGVDFWWVDWQQGESTVMKGLDPLVWLNHLHFQDSARGGQRPLLYSRWGGLGNHRYQTGFSGDTYVGWPALQFQPFFTATASNVAYGWWGHDIGGHMGGATEPELYARWVQYGALSPALRLHATKDPRTERRPWKYPEAVYRAAQAAFQWRYQLVPYIYTMARVAHDTGLSLCRPMYYEYPEEEAAYAARYQYFFGDQMIAAPIVHPADPDSGLAAVDVWVPPGTWIEYTTKETFSGPRWVRLVADLDRVPILVKAGAILPLAPAFESVVPGLMASGTTGAIPRDRLILAVFPKGKGRFRLYEDDGRTESYLDGQYEWTEISSRMVDGTGWQVDLAPVAGRCDALPEQRSYEVRLEGSSPPDRVLVNGSPWADWTYDRDTLRTTIQVPAYDKGQKLAIVAQAEGSISALGPEHNEQWIRTDVERLIGEPLPESGNRAALLAAILPADAPGKIHAAARLGAPFVRFIEFTTPEEATQQLGRVIIGGPAVADQVYDAEIDFSLAMGGRTERKTVRMEGLTSLKIVDVPFAFDGQVRAARWWAEARITWRGATWTQAHESQELFPAIHTWQGLVYDRDREPLAVEGVIDREGRPNSSLIWKPYVQTTEGLINVNQPHGAFFMNEYGAQLKAGARLGAYLSTIVNSPDERQAIVRFRAAGPVQLYLNGALVEEEPVKDEPGVHPLFREARKTASMYLRAGKNYLVVDSKSPDDGTRYWFFGGAFAATGGQPMIDLGFDLSS